MTIKPNSAIIESKPRSRLIKMLYGLVGGLALALGIIGIFLPGLPTTPFVLLAAACFAKASPRVHLWMLQHKLIGPMLRNWEEHRSLTRRTKSVAIISMSVMIALSIWHFSSQPWIQLALLLLGCIGAATVLRIPTRLPASSSPNESSTP
jgi:uncharacterized membrane protein YbaN (DUF454 family)